MLRRKLFGFMKRRIGIYSGTFNPIHTGHIGFALQAIDIAGLDEVYFLPERYRLKNNDVAHFGHRTAMIRQALKPHKNLHILELNDISFSVKRTWPGLLKRFSGDDLAFLVGSDVLQNLGTWPHVGNLLESVELIVGVRSGDAGKIQTGMEPLPVRPRRTFFINSYAGDVSSTKVRAALRSRKNTQGVLSSVERYSRQNWLYISLV